MAMPVAHCRRAVYLRCMSGSHSAETLLSENRRAWWRDRCLPLIRAAIALSLIAAMLWVNALDVRLLAVRLFYGAIACWLVVSFVVRSFRIWQFEKSGQHRPPIASSWKLAVRALDIGSFAVVWLLALEAGARALPPTTNSSLNYPGHRFVWPERYARRNSLGLNDWEPGDKADGPRVLVLGDSYVEGAGVRRSDRFCSQLQALLRKSQPEAQVIAGGSCGWNTHDELRFLEEHGPQLAPDVVVVSYVLNDAEGEEPLMERPTRWELWLQTRLNSYLCYRLFRLRKPGFDAYWQQVRQQHQPDSASWRGVEESLRKIAAWCNRRKVPCYLVVMPIFARDADAVRDVMDQVVERAAGLGFAAYSTLDDFDDRWVDFAVSPHDAHPNAAGHERIARRIAKELAKIRRL
jgi:lysophospholipase L1-like esterase